MDDLLNIGGVLTDQHILNVLYSADQRLVLVLQCGFANAVDTLIGIDLNESPVCAEAVYYKGFNVCDLHNISPYHNFCCLNSKPFCLECLSLFSLFLLKSSYL